MERMKSVIAPKNYSNLKTIPISIENVRVDGFWNFILKRNREISMPSLYKLFIKYNTIGNFEIEVGIKKGKKTKRLATDSDLYKWIEGVSWDLQNEWNENNIKLIEKLIFLIGKAQKKTGYINTSQFKKKFENLKFSHELYCGGHLIQASIAHYRSTGKENFLNIAIKWSNFICKNFGKGKIEKVDGHPEVEMALIELYRTTGNKKYLQMAKFFLETENPEYCGLPNIPFLKFKELTGHAVRMLYLTCGATDYYIETGDRKYLDVLEKLWKDLVERKIYITGGIGSRYENEAIGYPYELPNLRSYCESCASIAGMMWAYRMFLIKGESEYFDIFETILYNSFLASISFDGKKYFYVNPVASIGNHERKEWYDTTCCPPNIQRFVSTIPGYFYGLSKDGIYINLYGNSNSELNLLSGGKVKIKQITDYPWSGKVCLEIDTETPFNLYIRIPIWSKKTTINLEKRKYYPENGKYFMISVNRKTKIFLNFDNEAKFIIANPYIESSRNCLAIKRGPLIYCLESIDNPKINLLNSLIWKQKLEEKFENIFGGIITLKGEILTCDQKLPLYSEIENFNPKYQKKKFIAIPYFLWANRGKSIMVIWIPKK